MKTHGVTLLLGSNLGDRAGLLDRANALISGRIGTILRASRRYETPPWGLFEPEPDPKAEAGAFLNQALLVETPLLPEPLLDATQAIETELGRKRRKENPTRLATRSGLYRSRPMDIDILLYETQIVQSQRLTIPHPGLHLRRFALEPLAEIAPEALHPVFKCTIEELFRTILLDNYRK